MSAPNASAAPQPAAKLADDHALALDFEHLSWRVRKRRVVLFFGRAAFSDNTKYAYLHALAREHDYEVLWCTGDDTLATQLESHGLPVLRLLADIDRSIDTLMHASVALFSLNPFESVGGKPALLGCLAGAKKIQLWHGISVKQLTLQLIPHLGARDRSLRSPWVASSSADVVLSTASCFDAYWREVFGCRHFLRAGFPRNEVFLRPPETLELLGAELDDHIIEPLHAGRPNVLVVPTWQRYKATPLTEAEFYGQALRFARTHDVNVFAKLHPTYYKRWDGAGVKTRGLYLLDPGVDLYPWLGKFDTLVTDYSSIMFDYLLTGKPVMTLDIASGGHQNFEPDYSLVPPGDFRRTFTTDTFDAVLSECLFNDQGTRARTAYAEQIFETDPTQASEQIMRLVDALVDDAQQPDWQVIGA